MIDQRLTQMILKKAPDRMSQVYVMVQEVPKPGAPHIDTCGNHTDPGNGPSSFKKYEEDAGGRRVLSMLEVMTGSEKMEDEAIASEQDSQGAYDNCMKDSNQAIISNTEKISNMEGARRPRRTSSWPRPTSRPPWRSWASSTTPSAISARVATGRPRRLRR